MAKIIYANPAHDTTVTVHDLPTAHAAYAAMQRARDKGFVAYYAINNVAEMTARAEAELAAKRGMTATASPSLVAEAKPERKPGNVSITIDGGRNGNGPHCTVTWSMGDKSRTESLSLHEDLNGQQAMIEGLLVAFKAIKWPCNITVHGNGTIDLLVACAKRGGKRKDGKHAQNAEKLAELGQLMTKMASVEMIKE